MGDRPFWRTAGQSNSTLYFFSRATEKKKTWICDISFFSVRISIFGITVFEICSRVFKEYSIKFGQRTLISLLVVCGRLEFRVESHHLGDEGVALLLNFLPCAIFPGVQPLALAVVNGLRRWRPENGRKEDKNNKKHQYICYRWRHCINKLDILSSPDLNDGSFISLDRNL